MANKKNLAAYEILDSLSDEELLEKIETEGIEIFFRNLGFKNGRMSGRQELIRRGLLEKWQERDHRCKQPEKFDLKKHNEWRQEIAMKQEKYLKEKKRREILKQREKERQKKAVKKVEKDYEKILSELLKQE